MRRAGEGSIECNLTATNPLPNRNAIFKNKHNKHDLSRVLSTLNIVMDCREDGGFRHDEADVTMILYLIQSKDPDP